MKGIILAGGSGSRLFPLTLTVSKQLLPVYDKPMIYYPLSTLMLAGIREILIISTPQDTPTIKSLLGDGRKLGMMFSYAVQEKPSGLAQAYILGEEFLAGDSSCLILGDNIFYGQNLGGIVSKAAGINSGAKIFGYKVKDPKRYGIVEFDEELNILSIEEKPESPKSDYAIVGLYVFDGDAPSIAKTLKPSPRGELEITDVIQKYMDRGELDIELFGRGFAWLDTGTHEALIEASNFVRIIEERQGVRISCIEEIAWRSGFIDSKQLRSLGDGLSSSPYGQYIISLYEGNK